MKTITRQDMANAAAERFRTAYSGYNWKEAAAWKLGKTKAEIWTDLKSLGASPNPDDVDRVIGNDSWTHEMCSCCNAHPDRWIVVDVTGGEYATILCEKCVDEMKEAFKK